MKDKQAAVKRITQMSQQELIQAGAQWQYAV